MSSLSCNPGRRLVLDASLELRHDVETPQQRRSVVVDRDTSNVVSLAQLLTAFTEDPSAQRLGRVRITIEPGGGP